MLRRVAVVAVIAVVGTLAPPAAADTGFIMGSARIGISVNGIARTGPYDTMPTFAGSVRLFSSGVSWRKVQTTPTTFFWTRLDLALERARASGMDHVLYTLGDLPRWASVPDPRESGDIFGPGSASFPKDPQDYLDYVRAVVTRYKGRIDAYEIWNESNAPNFYRGTAMQLARLTKSARAVIKSIDPAAQVVGPSWMLRYWTPQRRAQMQALKSVGWPIDVVSIHSYPSATGGPLDRVELIRSFKAELRRLGVPKTPIWDTEVNFGDERPGYPLRSYSGVKASAWIAQAYLDSLRYGIQRTYWYAWDTRFLGIDLTDAQGRPTSTARSVARLRTWLVGYRWRGCSTIGAVTRCRVPTASGSRRTLVFTRKGTSRLALPMRVRSVCSLDGTCRKPMRGKRLAVSIEPLLIIGGRL